MHFKAGYFLLLVFALTSCGSFKQNIMFRTGEGFQSEPLQKEVGKAESNYIIKKNDILLLELYSNNGEKLIDPNPELSQSTGKNGSETKPIEYLVDEQGLAKFPMTGEVKLEGLTIRQSEMMLQKEYEKFFKAPFVKLKFHNKRVIVLGSPGGQVLPLTNENVNLVEVLAMAHGIDNNGKVQNIKVLRGEKVFVIDLSTIEGYRDGNMRIEPGDIVYVEPVRRPLTEGYREYNLIFSLIATATTVIVLLTR